MHSDAAGLVDVLVYEHLPVVAVETAAGDAGEPAGRRARRVTHWDAAAASGLGLYYIT